MTTFYPDTHIDLVYSDAGYDITTYIWLTVIAKKSTLNAVSYVFGSNFSRMV